MLDSIPPNSPLNSMKKPPQMYRSSADVFEDFGEMVEGNLWQRRESERTRTIYRRHILNIIYEYGEWRPKNL